MKKTKIKILYCFASIMLCIFLVACDKGKKPYEEAEALLNQSDYVGAKSKAEEVIQNTPNSKYVPKAKEIIEKAERILTLFKEAEQATEAKDYKKIIKSYEEVLSLDTKNQRANDGLKTAKETFKKQLIEKANSQLQEEDYEGVIESYKEILSFEPNNHDATEAVNKAEKALAETPSFADDSMKLIRKSKDVIIANFGRPDRMFEIQRGIIRFIYGETREGWITEDIFRITPAIMFDFKNGKVYKITKSFQGMVSYRSGGVRGFSRVHEYMDMKGLKPVEEQQGRWAYVTWKSGKYKFVARCIITDRIENYYLAMLEIEKKE